MPDIALFEPEIPPNTGNIIRLTANAGVGLHLIKPLGFEPDDKQLKRAGLDYHSWASLKQYENFQEFKVAMQQRRILAISTKGQQLYSQVKYRADDVLLLGPETRGLPIAVLEQFEPQNILRIPMVPNNRSLNLSNAAAIVLYEAWRQLDFYNGN
ncbi:MAG: TrmH family methyltransferase [Gammaproteobacteria bacterium]|jgi:tRNA (cytidine/uridine-2'-O-)-methyltransferase|nr:TrmH family methyltransferase [Gammaproteobacteria bacterium]